LRINRQATLYAASQQSLFKSTDNGVTWRTTGSLANGRIVALDPQNPSTAYALQSQLAGIPLPELLLKSTDSGSTWAKLLTGLFSQFVRKLLIDPANPSVMYIAAQSELAPSFGLFKSTDGGAGWKELLGEVPLSGFGSTVLAPGTPAAIYAASGSPSADAFVAKLSSTGSQLHYYTYLGGSDEDRGNGIAVDATGTVYVTGETRSANFPLSGGFQPGLHALNLKSDAFLTKLDAGGNLAFSTYFGGSSSESFLNSPRETASAVAIDRFNNAYIVGTTPQPTCLYPTACSAMAATEMPSWRAS
jgi:hypothetical protein